MWCNAKNLVNTRNFNKWTYVRQNLNRIWLYGAATGKENLVKTVKSLKI
jgi:hypothetical protein